MGDLLECFWRGFWACYGGMPRGGFIDSWLFEGADHFGFFPVFSWFLEVRKLDLTLENLSESSISLDFLVFEWIFMVFDGF